MVSATLSQMAFTRKNSAPNFCWFGKKEKEKKKITFGTRKLVGALRPFNHKGLSQGWRRLSLKRWRVERTNKADMRPEEQSEKAESYRENLRNEIPLKRPWKQKRTQEQNKKEWANSFGLCQRLKRQHLHHMKVGPWGRTKKCWLQNKEVS